jgi:DUF4097 and DUF4098 domain-containing protein YvlB
MKTFETHSPISVDIELAVANITIGASDRLDTTVDVQPTHPDRKSDVDMAANITVDLVDGRLRIARPRGNRGWRPGHFRDSVDVHVELPAGSSLRGTAGVVMLECNGRVGEVSFRAGVATVRIDESGPASLTAGSGDIEVGHTIGDVVVKTNGAVRIGTVDGDVYVKNSNGNTTIHEGIGEVRVRAANGDVVVEHARSNVGAKSANGNVRVGHAQHGSITAETARGKVEVGVGDGVAAWLDLTTAFGTVRNELENAGPPAADQDTIQVRARTAFGDITIRRAAA